MDCLELNIHQRILSDIASNVGDSSEDIAFAESLITPNVQTRIVDENVSKVNGDDEYEKPKVFMSVSRVHCNIAFGQLVVNFSDQHISKHIDTLMPVLIELLRDVPHIEFDKSLAWNEWSLPDQLVFSTVSALLRISSGHRQHTDQMVKGIKDFVEDITNSIKKGDASDVLVHFAPALHGLYRAVCSTPFPWTTSQWMGISQGFSLVCEVDVVDRLNSVLVEIAHQQDVDSLDSSLFVQSFLARYVSRGRPLSGYFMVCCMLEANRAVISSALTAPHAIDYRHISDVSAANVAWSSLLRQEVSAIEVEDEEVTKALNGVATYAMQCFTDLLVQVEGMESKPPIDTYVWETMSESLKLAAVSSITLRDLNELLYDRLLLLLNEDSPVSETMVQVAALQTVAVVVRSFPAIAPEMSGHIRHFVTSPHAVFEFELASEGDTSPPIVAAAKCLALCIKLSPADDLVLSNMYSLLNYIAATSKELHDSSSMSQLGNSFIGSLDDSTMDSMAVGLRGLSEDDKRLVGISTISVVTRLALEFEMDEVTKLTVSMLLQRLQTAEPNVEAAIAHNLVDLALAAPESAFIDIIRAFSVINRSANPDDPRFSSNMVLAAQTRLAQTLSRRPELYEIYLIELLTLFADKAVAVQNVKMTNPHISITGMIEQLASLLLPIDALLSHTTFSPHLNPSPAIVSLFRNMWFLCALFHFTSENNTEESAMGWQRPALARIASKTPAIVIEESHDSVASDVEYNSVIRQDYAGTVISTHRAYLTKHIATRASDIRYLSSGQVVFLLAMHDMETMRSAQGLTSSLVTYFVNDSLNRNAGLTACMEAIAEKVIRGCVRDLNIQASRQALPSILFTELKNLLIGSTHRVEKAREVALRFLHRLVSSFPSLMCEPSLVLSVLEVLTLLRRGCENEFTDEYNPIFEYHSTKADITLQLTDNFAVRNTILTELHRSATGWFELALARAPLELQSTLQKYLAMGLSSAHEEGSELGASLAEKFAKAIGPGQRKLTSLTDLSAGKMDKSRSLFTQLLSKGYFYGEVAGIRLTSQIGIQTLHKSAPEELAPSELDKLKQSLDHALRNVHEKTGSLTILDLKRLLFRCAATLVSSENCDYDLIHYLIALPFEASTPVAIANGIEAWTWVIAEKPHMEVALMGEILSAWSDTIDQAKGIFSTSLNYSDPFVHPVNYSPSDREEIERGGALARRLLAPLGLVLQMLLSRMQAARYRRPGVMFMLQHLILRSADAHKSLSTHSLSRESRFSFLLFGLETLRSSHLDVVCENRMREGLYYAAYSWFSVSPQWTYGANRVQLDADVKVLSEFLAYLQNDLIRAAYAVTSLSSSQSSGRQNHHVSHLRSINTPLKLLVENEIYRLSVWTNPTNDPRRGVDQLGSTERQTTDSSLWPNVVRTTWSIDPAIAVFLTERFKSPVVKSEVTKLVRSSPTHVLGIPDALPMFVGEKSDGAGRRDLKFMLLWAPVPPILATNYFGPQYESEPIVLQYAHRVMEQHPIDLTFFFVPQVVQALRYDKLGYVSRFIFETAKISQLFCHQIIWNMKANCFRGDEGIEEDPMRPELEKTIDAVVHSLSGEARAFYDREFRFFNEVTSISGKLKPFITKTKPEKKAKIDEEMAKLVVDVGVYLPSNPDGVVVDIDKKSGRPLQSHAKAPFMATFKVRKEKVIIDADPDSLLEDDAGTERRSEYDVWQQAIFKVGDDCRQDVLALQIIAMFKNIFTGVGLTLYLYPYRVTATAPGCGVIDVVPNATSRDEMGRAKVNDLMDFFVAKYGGQDTVAFQEARLKFIQSMAAYSVACYILQIKDRHNGNIMIDGEGHIVHIDFGFLFDIANVPSNSLRPGGVKFEPSSFKLNHEMVILMGGRYSQGYQLFQHLTVKAFLAIRPYTEQLVSTIQLMLGTGLPSFKGEGTIKRLRERFAPGVNERQAAEFMMGIIKNAHENMRSTVYDEFQRLQNGIPYK